MRSALFATSVLFLCSLSGFKVEAQLQCGNGNTAVIPRDCASALNKFYKTNKGLIISTFRSESKTAGSCQVTLTTQNSGYVNVDAYATSTALTQLNTKCPRDGAVIIGHGSTKGGLGDSVILEVGPPSTAQIA